MDETGKMTSGTGAIMMIFFFFFLSLFLLNKYGKSTQRVEVENNVGQNFNLKQTREEVLRQMKMESRSEIYGKYLDLLDRNSSTSTTEAISNDFKSELETTTLLPEQVVFLKNRVVGNSYNEKEKYLNDFENTFIKARKKGVFSESTIFATQAGPKDSTDRSTILPLSPYDKGTVLRIATEYDLWAEEILQLETPSMFEKKSLETVRNILNTSYILRKLVEEEDSQIYLMWIGKYMQIVFDIIALRYAR
jgi:hypothetical protein